MENLQFSTNSHLKPEKLMSFIIDFEYYKNFFPGQLKEIKILDRQNNEITTEESVIFTSLLKSSFVQKSCHKLISDKELLTEIIEGPAKGSVIKVICIENDQGSVFTDRNSVSRSLVDAMKPHQIGFNLVNNQSHPNFYFHNLKKTYCSLSCYYISP